MYQIRRIPLPRALISMLLVFLTVPAAGAGLAAGQASEQDTLFARVKEDAQRRPLALQMAIATYVPASDRSGVSVDLISAVHIGDRSYYQALNQRFETYDVLLYELIIPDGAAPPRSGAKGRGFISGTQSAMKSALGLSFQLDEIDYRRQNFVHADLTSSELAESMEDRNESLYVYFWRAFYAAMKQYAQDPLGLQDIEILSTAMVSDQDSAMKTAMAYELTDIDRVGDFLDGGSSNGSAIIASRNERALEVLQRELDAGNKRIGIFYGVAHMPHFEEHLFSEFGMVRESTVWIDAWSLTADSASNEDVPLEKTNRK